MSRYRKIMSVVFVVLLIPLLGQMGACGALGQTTGGDEGGGGEDTGDPLLNLTRVVEELKDDTEFLDAVKGDTGAPGLDCWDLDGDGLCDLADDANDDGECNALDCQGSDGGGGGVDEDITAVAAGTGLTGGGNRGAVTLGIETGGVTSSHLANNAVTLGKIDSSGATSGQAIMYDGTSVAWTSPGGGPPSGAAGGDLTGNYPNPDIAADAVTSAHLADNSVTTSKIADDAVTGDKIAQQDADPGEVLKWNGATWAPAPDLTGDGGSPWGGGAGEIFYSGNVAIGTSSGSSRTLEVVDAGGGIEFDMRQSGGVVHIRKDSDDDCFEVDGHSTFGGTVSFRDMAKFWDDIRWVDPPVSGGTPIVINDQGIFYKQSSSLRYKSSVADLPLPGNAVLALRPVSFEWNSTGEPDIGLIAEEVAEAIPDLVLYDVEGRPDGVKYDRLGVYLLQVVKSQGGEIAAQEQRLERMERELAELKAKTRRH